MVVSRKFQGRFDGVSRKFQGCFKEVSRVFQVSFKGVSWKRKFQGCFLNSVSGFSRMFPECFKEVSRKLYCLALIAASRAEGGLVAQCNIIYFAKSS